MKFQESFDDYKQNECYVQKKSVKLDFPPVRTRTTTLKHIYI